MVKQSTQEEGGRAFFQKSAWLGFFLVGLGTMVFLFSGCGSDSPPKGGVSGKKEKAVNTGGSKSPAIIPLMTDKEGTGSATVKKEPVVTNIEEIPGLSRAELEERAAAERKRIDSPNHEVLPGLTRAELEARAEADRKKSESPNYEVLPGLTRSELEARMAAERKRKASPDSEVLPGITKGELEAKMAADRKRLEAPGAEVLPGLTKEELEAKTKK